MSDDKLAIFNEALTMAQSRGLVSDVSENSREAELCRLHYDATRREILSAGFWDSARLWARLTKHADQTDPWIESAPSVNWLGSFNLPANLLRPRYLSSYAPFTIDLEAAEPTRKLLQTDDPEPLLYYTIDQTSIPVWEVALRAAIVAFLAFKLSLSFGKVSRTNRLADTVRTTLAGALANAGNDEDTRVIVQAPWMEERGLSVSTAKKRYVYPFEELNLGSV